VYYNSKKIWSKKKLWLGIELLLKWTTLFRLSCWDGFHNHFKKCLCFFWSQIDFSILVHVVVGFKHYIPLKSLTKPRLHWHMFKIEFDEMSLSITWTHKFKWMTMLEEPHFKSIPMNVTQKMIMFSLSLNLNKIYKFFFLNL
jgi:hypothetical protein